MIALSRPPADPDKEAFHRYLTDFHAVEDEAALMDKFSDCGDILPMKYSELLFLPPASTYRDAVRLLLSSWRSPLGPTRQWQDTEDDLFDEE